MKTRFALTCLLMSAVAWNGDGAALPPGKIVWWGNGSSINFDLRNETNSVFEQNNEIVSNVVAIAARRGNALAVRSDGTVFSFGIGWFGLKNIPAGLSNVASVAIEPDNSCWAIRNDGAVAHWGGPAGDDSIVSKLSNVVSVAWAGFNAYLALQQDGAVLAFRIGVSNPALQPVKVEGRELNDVAAVASRQRRPLIVKKNGSVWQLAAGPAAPPDYLSADAVKIEGKALTDVVALATGDEQVLALKRDGTVIAWGGNDYGEADVPKGLSNVTAIAADEHLSIALKRDGTVAAWGGKYFHQTSVPAGLSNVVAIASGWQYGLALTTGELPPSVFSVAHGRLEVAARNSDLIFKGQVLSSEAVKNPAFQDLGGVRATRFKVISVLKGNAGGDTLTFWHYGDALPSGPVDFISPQPLSVHAFDAGQSCLVFAAKLTRPDCFYTVPSDAARRTNEFRQILNDPILRALDNRPLPAGDLRQAAWQELNLLLHDTNPSNQIYAIEQLDKTSRSQAADQFWLHGDDFKRETVLNALRPLINTTNQDVARLAKSLAQ